MLLLTNQKTAPIFCLLFADIKMWKTNIMEINCVLGKLLLTVVCREINESAFVKLILIEFEAKCSSLRPI